MKITSISTDFTQYPVINPTLLGLEPDADYPQELTLGDLSGNLLMLMWVLVTAGLAHMSEQNYLALVKLQQAINASHKNSFHPVPMGAKILVIDYKKVPGLTREQNELFKTILADTHFKSNPKLLLRLLGDEVADRLGDDSLMINTLDEMANQKLNYRILGSNHLHYLVENFLSKKPIDPEEEEEETFDDLIPNGQGVSLLHMIKSIENNVTDENEIRRKIASIYPPRLWLIDYSEGNTDTDMSLFAHAPFSLYRIVKAAEYLGVCVPTMFLNTHEVIAFINAINNELKKRYVDVYFSGKSKQDMPVLDDQTAQFAGQHSAIGALFWMKDHQKLSKDPVPKCFEKIKFNLLLHGHTDGPFSLNSSSQQSEKHYTFSVAVSANKAENALSFSPAERQTDSPVALTENRQRMHYFYKHSLLETTNNSASPSPAISGVSIRPASPAETTPKHK